MQSRDWTAHPTAEPTVVYDGDCEFCKFWVRRWQSQTGSTFQWFASQSVTNDLHDIPAEQFDRAVQLILPNGQILSGADAFFEILRCTPGWSGIAKFAQRSALILFVARWFYALVAKHRGLFSTLTRFLWGRNPVPATFGVGRRLFSAALGLVFISAFWSLGVQLAGLYGSRGVTPLAELLPAAREQLGSQAFTELPTLFWLGASDGALSITCTLGIVLAAGLTLGLAPGFCALGCWAIYLSFCSVGSPFLDFQWDTLLLETAALACLFLPWRLRPAWQTFSTSSHLGRLLIGWLLFRLMIESAAVKLASGDPTWRNLTALDFHFETQPLPLWTAWYAHHTSPLFHKLGVLTTFAIEFLAPLGIFAPRRVRHFCAWAMILLQLSILTTGNYAFFNWLTIALCIPLLDDSHWPAVLRRKSSTIDHLKRKSMLPRLAPWVVATSIFFLTAAQFLRLIGIIPSTLKPLAWIEEAVAPLRSFNTYGLFAVMTTERPEIILEGSNNGNEWRAYEFRWKPGSVTHRPKLVAPHQPRLDWQMWFAALGDIRQNRWLIRTMARLLEGSPEVLDLLDYNPFPDAPPKYIRAVRYRYHFTDEDETGPSWWRRDLVGLYCPAFSLEDLRPR